MSKIDVIALYHEDLSIGNLKVVDPKKSWKVYEVNEGTMEELLVPIFRKGELVYKVPTLEEIIAYSKQQQEYVMEEEKRFNYPHKHYVDLSYELNELKIQMLKDNGEWQ